ncbi:MAG: hypothetical protein KC983_11250, partial [Phycisphaerales bacterium]|nr:hypothetical protein [Phycisphaerales bacterium]
MQMITDLKSRFFRRKQVDRVSLNGTQAASLVHAARPAHDAGSDHLAESDDFGTDGMHHADSMIEAKPSKRQSMAELQRGYEEV